MKLYDMHCHVLPGMDDGCSSEDEALEILKRSRAQGVEMLAATPHYYPQESVDSFLQRRQESARALIAALNLSPVVRPAIYLGAEVAYYSHLTYEKQLRALCLGTSNYLLLEMPTEKWPSRVLRDIETIRSSMGLMPIIAHIERCFPCQDKDTLRALLDLDVLLQVNSSYLLSNRTRRSAKKLFKAGIVDFLGTDCHNLTSRPPNLSEAFDTLSGWGMDNAVDRILENSAYLFSQCSLRN